MLRDTMPQIPLFSRTHIDIDNNLYLLVLYPFLNPFRLVKIKITRQSTGSLRSG
jgi:hypothetical protein